MADDEVVIRLKLQDVAQFVRDSDRGKDAVLDIGSAVEHTDRRSRLASAASGGFSLLGKTIGWMARTAAVGASALTAAAVVMGGSAVSAASDLSETIGKTNVVFDKSGKSVVAWAKKNSSALMMSQNEALTAAANYGNLFNNMGFVEKASAKMSKQLVTTAADLASFHNTPTAEMLDAISSALAGEYDPLQRYGFAISAAAVKQQALNMGLIHGKQTMTAAQSAAATYALVLKQTGDAQGDAERTSGNLSSQQKKLAGQWVDLKAKAGAYLIPAVTGIYVQLNDKLMPALGRLVDKYGPRVAAWIQDVATKYGPRLIKWLQDFKFHMPSGQSGQDFSKIGDAIVGVFHSLDGMKGEALSGTADTVDLFARAMGVAADHADLLADALPYLAAGYVIYKAGQTAANVAALVSLPVQILQIAATFTQAKAIRGLSAAQGQNIGVSTAQAVATGRVSLATRAWSAAQWLLNLAMRAFPLILIITLIVGVGIAIWQLYKRNETFRHGVQAAGRAAVAAFGWIWDKATGLFGWVRKNWPLLLAILTGPIGLAVFTIVKHFDKIKDGFRAVVNAMIDAWNSLDFGVHIHLPKALGGWGVDIDDVFPDIPKLARGGTAAEGGLSIVGDGGKPELLAMPRGASVVPLDRADELLGGRDTDRTTVVQVLLDGRVVAEAVRKDSDDRMARL